MAYLLNDNIYNYIIFFAVYSLIGWVSELVYRLFAYHKIVNPGILYGPFLPIYGIPAVGVVIITNTLNSNLILSSIIGMLFATLLEYASAVYCEKVIGIKFWDYSGDKFNYKGRVCLQYSLLWGVLIFILLFALHPFVSNKVLEIPYLYKLGITAFILGLLVYDIIFTSVILMGLKELVNNINTKYSEVKIQQFKERIKDLSRITNAFPGLGLEAKRRFQSLSLKTPFHRNGESIVDTINQPPSKREYNSIVREIAYHEEFGKTRNYRHHHSSIYSHCLSVSYSSYVISKHLKLDYKSVARGALLHDFFLYDWRLAHPQKGRNHGLEHPKTALRNAMAYFPLNETEKDIIRRHMWPFTLALPQYAESYLVLIIDKYIASKELFKETRGFVRMRLKRTITPSTAHI